MTEQILICYDGSHGAERAADTAAVLLARQIDAAAIVIGPRGLGGFREFTRGSVANRSET